MTEFGVAAYDDDKRSAGHSRPSVLPACPDHRADINFASRAPG
ncbi:hypothetical protein [Streptomyces europaeiscabiei]|nr:hypothetical protein OHB30_23960 [Streptomyces europaeiscabiei]